MFLLPSLPIQPSPLNSGYVYPKTPLTLLHKTELAISTHLLPKSWPPPGFPVAVNGTTSHLASQVRNISLLDTCLSLVHCVQSIKTWWFYPLSLSQMHLLLTSPHHPSPHNSLFFISALFFFTHHMISLFTCCSGISTWLDSKLHRDRIPPGR